MFEAVNALEFSHGTCSSSVAATGTVALRRSAPGYGPLVLEMVQRTSVPELGRSR
jgi:hypothetical protein